jgi:uncharacterized protein
VLGGPPPSHSKPPPPAPLADAQYHLGLLHYYGEGYAPDPSAATRLFREAATKGHAQAAVNLAAIIEWGDVGAAGAGSGLAVAKDAAGAFAWYSAAAEGGDPRGMHGAGVMLYEGRVPGYDEHERFADAFALFEQAVERGHLPSFYYLGVLFEYGAHRPQDFHRAAELYRRGCEGATVTTTTTAAGSGGGGGDGGGGDGRGARASSSTSSSSRSEEGDADCCFHLGLLAAYGRGVEQDHVSALATFGLCERRHAHPGCLLYLGLMHASGQGVATDYEAARVYLQRASESGDVRFVPQAHEAFSKLDVLLREAGAGVTETLEGIARGLAARPGQGAAGDGEEQRQQTTTRGDGEGKGPGRGEGDGDDGDEL